MKHDFREERIVARCDCGSSEHPCVNPGVIEVLPFYLLEETRRRSIISHRILGVDSRLDCDTSGLRWLQRREVFIS